MKSEIHLHGVAVDFEHLGAWASRRAKALDQICSPEDIEVALLAQIVALRQGLPPPYPHEALMSVSLRLSNPKSEEETGI